MVNRARTSVIKSAKAGFRSEALRYVRSMKLLQLSREKCAGSMDKIENVLSLIADAETTKKVRSFHYHTWKMEKNVYRRRKDSRDIEQPSF